MRFDFSFVKEVARKGVSRCAGQYFTCPRDTVDVLPWLIALEIKVKTLSFFFTVPNFSLSDCVKFFTLRLFQRLTIPKKIIKDRAFWNLELCSTRHRG